MSDQGLLIGVDGGQTATKVLAVRQDGVVVGAGQGPAIDHFRVEGGAERNRAAIRDGIQRALTDAGVAVRSETVAAVGVGLTGVRTGDPITPVAVAIVDDLLPGVPVQVVADYETNLSGATGGEPGVLVIAGGGSIGYGRTADGREALASGYGYLLGDEGSAFWIGLKAINAVTRAGDGRGPATVLTAVVLDTLGIATIRESPPVIYREGFTRDTISRLAPAVVDAAGEGDAVAAEIIGEAGIELGKTALAVIRQLHPAGTPVKVAMTGGVFNAGEPIQRPFRDVLAESWPAATVMSPRLPPAMGGVILAARLAGGDPDHAWLARAETSLAERAAR